MAAKDRTTLIEASKPGRSKMISSLAAIVDSVEEGRFFGRKVPASALLAAARKIASRQGLPSRSRGGVAAKGVRLYFVSPEEGEETQAATLGTT
jgi:hypothetical protein